MYLLNTKTVAGKTYDNTDITGVKLLADYGLDGGFYGGRVHRIGLTKEGFLLMLDSNMNVIDIGTQDLELLPIENIKRLLNNRKMKFHHLAGKAKLISILEGKEVEDDNS